VNLSSTMSLNSRVMMDSGMALSAITVELTQMYLCAFSQ
jgi:hypothetical protein